MNTEPSLHSSIISSATDIISASGKGGVFASHNIQMTAWTREQESTIVVANFFPTHFFILDPGLVARKAKTTMMVLAKMHDTATEKMSPKVICRKRHIIAPGLKRNCNAQRKQSWREMRRA